MNIERVNSELQKNITDILRNDINDPRLDSFGIITIMEVQATSDLDNCKVFISVYGGEIKGKEAIKILQSMSNYIRKLLFERMKIRKIPSLSFHLDNTLDYVYKISNLIEEANKKEE
ncbi:MAG: 30S ribosome-binding factor RbfA [Clostridia bacterium]|jgi:ribosome-binding factor A|nr:30S ribosome-binding factor RbfA [Clostridia bacterium]